MKNIFIKAFLFVCAVVVLFEGIILLMVRFGFFPLKDALRFYSLLLQTPQRLELTLLAAVGFLLFGLILFSLALSKSSRPKSIMIKNSQGVLSIPLLAIEKFITEVLAALNQYSALADFQATVAKHGKWICVDVGANITRPVSIRQEVLRISVALRQQIEQVFAFPKLKISFRIDEVNNNHEKEDNSLTSKEVETDIFNPDIQEMAKVI